MAHLMPNLRQKFYDANGVALANGLVYFYQAGTSTPLATYQDKGELASNTNPVVLDANGEADIWLKDEAYKVVVKTSADVLVKSVDNVRHINLSSITKSMIDWNPAGDGLSLNGSDELDVQVDGSTLEISSNALRVKDSGITTPKIDDLAVTPAKLAAIPTSKLDKKIKLRRTSSGFMMPLYPWSGGTVAGRFPATAPAAPYVGEFSPDGKYLAVADGSSPYIFTYKKNLDSFVKSANPGTLPTGAGNDAAWSPCGEFLAVAHETTPFVSIYYLSGTNALNKFTNPGTLPGGAAYSVAWHPSGEYVAVTCTGAGDNVVIYRREGSAFTKISAPVGIPSGSNASGISFSPDGRFMAYGIASSPYINIFEISGATFTKLSNPASLPDDAVGSTAFSPDSSMLAISTSATPFFNVYSISGSTFTKLASPVSVPASLGSSVAWHPSGETLAVGHAVGAGSTTLTLYSASGSTLTKLSDLPSQISDNVDRISFSPDGRYLCASFSTGGAGTMRVWKTDSALDEDAVFYASEVLDV